VETDEVPENQVIDVFEAGYQMYGRVVRPARVSVSKRPAGS
jgi:molecular chaperone GrpE